MNYGLLGGFVRQAYLAQQALEQWEDGATLDVWGGRRAVSVETLQEELDAANAALIGFIQASPAS